MGWRRLFGWSGLLPLLMLAACGNTKPALPTPVPQLPPPSSSAGAAQPSHFTNQTWGAVVADPKRYVGAAVSLTGQIINVEQSETQTGIQIWTDPLRAAGNTVVIFPRAGFPQVSNGDQVAVEGKLVGAFAGENDEGALLTLPKVEASEVRVLSHASASGTPAPSAEVAAAVAKPPPTSTPTPRPIAAGFFRVSGTGSAGLTIRQRPAANSRAVGIVAEDGVLQVLAQAAPGWAQVRGTGFTGYVDRDYLAGPVAAGSAGLARLRPQAKASGR